MPMSYLIYVVPKNKVKEKSIRNFERTWCSAVAIMMMNI